MTVELSRNAGGAAVQAILVEHFGGAEAMRAVVAAPASPRHHELVHRLGAAMVVDQSAPDWPVSARLCGPAGPRPSGTAAAGDAGGRQHAQQGQHDRAAEHGAEITDVVGGDTDTDDRDGEA